MASKQPRRSDLTSDLKFMAQTTYATMLFELFWPSFGQMIKKKKENLSLLDLSASPQVKTRFSSSSSLLLPALEHDGVVLDVVGGVEALVRLVVSRAAVAVPRPRTVAKDFRHITLMIS